MFWALQIYYGYFHLLTLNKDKEFLGQQNKSLGRTIHNALKELISPNRFAFDGEVADEGRSGKLFNPC